MRVLIRNRQRQVRISLQKIESDSRKVLNRLGLNNAELSVLLVNDRRMRELNVEFRGVDRTTDVLSFPQISAKEQKFISSKVKESDASGLLHVGTFALVLGDVVVNPQAAKRQASEHGISFEEELRWLLVHGILHLLGYDHEKSRHSAIKMRKRERELLKYFHK